MCLHTYIRDMNRFHAVDSEEIAVFFPLFDGIPIIFEK